MWSVNLGPLCSCYHRFSLQKRLPMFCDSDWLVFVKSNEKNRWEYVTLPRTTEEAKYIYIYIQLVCFSYKPFNRGRKYNNLPLPLPPSVMLMQARYFCTQSWWRDITGIVRTCKNAGTNNFSPNLPNTIQSHGYSDNKLERVELIDGRLVLVLLEIRKSYVVNMQQVELWRWSIFQCMVYLYPC